MLGRPPLNKYSRWWPAWLLGLGRGCHVHWQYAQQLFTLGQCSALWQWWLLALLDPCMHACAIIIGRQSCWL